MKVLKYYVDEDIRMYSADTMNDLFWIRQALDTKDGGYYDMDQDACFDMWTAYSMDKSGGSQVWLPVPREDPEAIINALVEDI